MSVTEAVNFFEQRAKSMNLNRNESMFKQVVDFMKAGIVCKMIL